MKNDKTKILVLTPWYTKNMGYNNVCFPDALSKINNVEVHILTSQAQVYYNAPYYKSSYEKFHGKAILPVGTEKLDENLFLHRLEFKEFKTEIVIKHLYRHIKKINPDIIQTFDCNSINTFKLALYKPFLRYKLFTGNSIVLSVFPLDKYWEKYSYFKKLDWYFKHIIPGKFISFMSNKIYPSTIDAGYIAKKYFGANESKIKISPLGVDTINFKPNKDVHLKYKIREELGFNKNDFICIYTGRMTSSKNPLLLAMAIEWIKNNTSYPIKALFLGDGEQLKEIESKTNVKVLGFKQYKELPIYYQISDIGVWPTQESTSMLDAASCGLPIIVSSELKAIERIKGNGLQYQHNNFEDLANKIIKLYTDKNLYKKFSINGINKMKNEFSWKKIALNKLHEYKQY
jgi:glycosyltransferase involved in cell wall biosynthesis